VNIQTAEPPIREIPALTEDEVCHIQAERHSERAVCGAKYDCEHSDRPWVGETRCPDCGRLLCPECLALGHLGMEP
jgi:hypothetical protein